MLIVVSLMLCGIAVGYMLRNKNTRIVSRIITVLIWLLLFLLGIEALLLTIGGAVGTTLCAWLLWIYVSRKEARK